MPLNVVTTVAYVMENMGGLKSCRFITTLPYLYSTEFKGSEPSLPFRRTVSKSDETPSTTQRSSSF